MGKLTVEQMAALAAAGYTKADIDGMTAAPPTVESLTEQNAALQAQLDALQSANVKAAEAPKQKTAEEILAGVTAEKTPPDGAK